MRLFNSIKKRAFTLMELLASISVITILAALAMPTILKGLRQSEESRCINRLRQQGKAVVMYAGNHDFWMPPSRDHRSTNEIYSSQGKNALGLLYPEHNRDLRIYFCPSGKINKPDGLEGLSNWGNGVTKTNYTYISGIGKDPSNSLKMLGNYSMAENKVILTDQIIRIKEDLSGYEIINRREMSHDDFIHALSADNSVLRIRDLKSKLNQEEDFDGKGIVESNKFYWDWVNDEVSKK